MEYTSDVRPDRLPAFDVLAKRTHRWRLHSLPIDVLRRMEETNRRQTNSLVKQGLAIEERMAAAAESGDLARLEQHLRDFRLVEQSHFEHSDAAERIRNAYQERIMRNRLSKTLGGEKRYYVLEGVVLVLIILVLGLLLYEYFTPGLAESTILTFFLIDTACCVVFLADFALRMRSAESKRWFMRNHWVDLVTSIPLPPTISYIRAGRVFRVARIMRLARLARFLRILRAVRLVLFFWRGMDKLNDVLDMRLMKKSLMLGIVVLLMGGILIQRLEGAAESVGTIGEAIWWSFTTVVTGGYGDIHNPVSGPGRAITVLLVIAGMIIVGVFTATLTALLVGDEAAEVEMMQRELGEALDKIGSRVEQLAERIEA